MGSTPGTTSPRSLVVDRLKEANSLLEGMDESVRAAIQQCEADIASTDCTVQFWTEPLLLAEALLPDETDEEALEEEDKARGPVPGRRESRGYQIGWSKVGKSWQLTYREARRISFPNPNAGSGPERFTIQPVGKARPLVDAPRLVKAASIEGLNDFVNILAEHVVALAQKIHTGLAYDQFNKGESR